MLPCNFSILLFAVFLEKFANFAFMKIRYKFLSLTIALLMMAGAALSVNNALFGHSFHHPLTNEIAADSLMAEHITFVDDSIAVVHTAGLPSTQTGYAGPVPLDIYIKNGRVHEIEPLENSETPSFLDRASVLLGIWIGKTVEEGASIEGVDAISGATYTSIALISNVKAGLQYYEGVAAESSPQQTPRNIWIAFAVVLSACVIPLLVKNKFYMYAQLMANVIVLGFWCGQFLDYSLMIRYVSFGIPTSSLPIVILMLAAAFIYPLFGKPQHYCLHICPLGSAQQLAGSICGFKVKIRPSTLKALNWTRKILWFVLMVLLWLDCFTQWMDLELFQAFQLKSASIGIIIAALAFLALSTIVNRPYCRFVCPTGSLFKQAEKFK